MNANSSPFSLEGRNIMITGASSGIGRAVASQVSKMGGRVIALGRDHDKLGETLKLLEGEGHVSHSVDLTDTVGIEARLADICKEAGPLHGLVHSAGVTRTMLLRDTDLNVFMEMMNLNYTAFIALAKSFCRRGRHAADASVVGISSSAAETGQPGLSLYSGTKGALSASIRSLAAEYAPRGIRFNALSPTYVSTPMLTEIRSFLGEDRFKSQILDASPLGILEPEDVANAAAFLLSPASKRITGTTIALSAGA
jgi:NAD(P)-dependent dehydrogenase (short-subunit alcohol dehydrogenase family)